VEESMIAIARVAGSALMLLLCGTHARASVEISFAPTQNMSCSAGVCLPTAKKAVLNANDLAAMLANEDVKITTGNGAVTITVFAPFSWTSTHRLTLDAYYNVSVRAPVTVAGQGAVTILTNDGGAGGDLIFFPGAKLDFWNTASSLVINGKNYTLLTDIKTLAQDISSHPSHAYALAKHYNAAADGTYHSVPIATFSGIFEGLGHSIDNLMIDVRNVGFVGLFGILDGAVVRDLNLTHGNVEAKGRQLRVGLVAGLNDGTVENTMVSATINVKGNQNLTGGILGQNNQGDVRLCISMGSVNATGSYSVAGGLVGENDGSVSHGVSSASVVAYWAGGLVGLNETGTVVLSYATGNVISYPSFKRSLSTAGGLVGYNQGAIEQSFATGTVQGTSGTNNNTQAAYAGGLLGFSNGIVSNAYALGSASVGDHALVGGFAGGGSSFTSSYSTGAPSSAEGNSRLGGFQGTAAEDGTQDYWDTDTSGTSQGCGNSSCDGVTGLSDVQLKSGVPAGFDPTIWAQSPSINNGYPYLIANPPRP
jgi:hypothetical protein